MRARLQLLSDECGEVPCERLRRGGRKKQFFLLPSSDLTFTSEARSPAPSCRLVMNYVRYRWGSPPSSHRSFLCADPHVRLLRCDQIGLSNLIRSVIHWCSPNRVVG